MRGLGFYRAYEPYIPDGRRLASAIHPSVKPTESVDLWMTPHGDTPYRVNDEINVRNCAPARGLREASFYCSHLDGTGIKGAHDLKATASQISIRLRV
ncbi:hypothetical protein Mp_4g00570 [Marchantia polymorpha subsp. ruderalis]|uniref:Uncharacterized protein n=2 Tax=Marchantia polymorpha TaxID=3197 RepID=A0AAF6B4W9_MARPO|nr:hypothetical protein MARPO_0066s0084 [Marchantia polymorpha]BBN07053.1 hypothetical protein Mp_4g00570 [Marchantia polymorpha subsp. ruderalis]|eukprot:PTQ36131.1 hypothetical protein MARPO_0066s0084 [Marchantia polymorpha]